MRVRREMSFSLGLAVLAGCGGGDGEAGVNATVEDDGHLHGDTRYR